MQIDRFLVWWLILSTSNTCMYVISCVFFFCVCFFLNLRFIAKNFIAKNFAGGLNSDYLELQITIFEPVREKTNNLGFDQV